MTSQPRGVSPDPGKLLDERTEKIITQIVWGDRGCVPLLRSRIRELIEEARIEGFGRGSLMTGRGMLGFDLDGTNGR